jgi:hypothetical protein
MSCRRILILLFLAWSLVGASRADIRLKTSVDVAETGLVAASGTSR